MKLAPQIQLPTSWREMAARIDYSDLRVDTKESDLRLLCLEAEKYNIPTVVVNPINVPLAVRFTRGTNLKVAAAVSYPVGAYAPDAKSQEVTDALEDGADEIYMMMAVGAYRSGWIDSYTIPEMQGLVKSAGGRPTRLITEASVLSDVQKREVCRLAIDAGIDAIVACTGFLPSKLPTVSLRDLQVLVEAADHRLEVIFMGDVESFSRASEIITCGVERLCTGSVRRILTNFTDFPGTL